MSDIKQMLLKLGDKLIREHGFEPAKNLNHNPTKTTDSLVQFLIWLDKTPEAREELENLGFSFLRTVPF